LVYDLLGWTVLSWLVIRALRDGRRSWLLVGVTLGIALEVKTLILFLVAGLIAGIVAVGPRHVLASRCRGSPRPSLWRCGHRTCGGRSPTDSRSSR